MSRTTVLDLLERRRLLAIFRGDFRDKAVDLAGVLYEAGLRVVEVTTVSPGWAKHISAVVDAFGDMAVGAGTVLTAEQVQQAADAGASFIVSPDTNGNVIAATRALGLASFPGALTPTEILRAVELGADAVKLFPASALGPSYLRALRGPLPSLRFIPTGGVHSGNIREYLERGAWAVAVGSELVRSNEADHNSWPELRQRAQTLVDLAGGPA
jgi:Entner-Doudoroff aldolase